MELEKILHYAYIGALEVWSKKHDKLSEDPNNKSLNKLEKKAWEDYLKIAEIYDKFR